MRQKRFNFRGAKLTGVPLAMKQDVAMHPLKVGMFGADRIMPEPDPFAHLLEKPRGFLHDVVPSLDTDAWEHKIRPRLFRINNIVDPPQITRHIRRDNLLRIKVRIISWVAESRLTYHLRYIPYTACGKSLKAGLQRSNSMGFPPRS